MKAGIPLPVNPIARNNFQSFQGTSLRRKYNMGVKAMADMEMRMHAKSNGSKAINAFLISMNELPQIILNARSIANDLNSTDFSCMKQF